MVYNTIIRDQGHHRARRAWTSESASVLGRQAGPTPSSVMRDTLGASGRHSTGRCAWAPHTREPAARRPLRRLQIFAYVQAPTLARPPDCTHRRTLSPRRQPSRLHHATSWLVTCPRPWHRFAPNAHADLRLSPEPSRSDARTRLLKLLPRRF